MNGLTGIALAAILLAACSQQSGAELTQKLAQQKSVTFNTEHLACLNEDLLNQAESYQKDGRLDGVDGLRRVGKCEMLPSNTEFPVMDIVREDKNSAVIGVMKNPTALSVVLFTRYQSGS